MSPLCGSVWGRAHRGDSTAAWPLEFCPGESCLPTLALPVSPLSPHMSLVPFQLYPGALVLNPRAGGSV